MNANAEAFLLRTLSSTIGVVLLCAALLPLTNFGEQSTTRTPHWAQAKKFSCTVVHLCDVPESVGGWSRFPSCCKCTGSTTVGYWLPAPAWNWQHERMQL